MSSSILNSQPTLGTQNEGVLLLTDAWSCAFQLWPREAMIDLLVMQNIELRHEDELVHFQLVNICNQVRGHLYATAFA